MQKLCEKSIGLCMKVSETKKNPHRGFLEDDQWSEQREAPPGPHLGHGNGDKSQQKDQNCAGNRQNQGNDRHYCFYRIVRRGVSVGRRRRHTQAFEKRNFPDSNDSERTGLTTSAYTQCQPKPYMARQYPQGDAKTVSLHPWSKICVVSLCIYAPKYDSGSREGHLQVAAVQLLV